ncbi:ATP-dependent Clp protease ATP-binding subunit CLPT1, chloroplastic-like isoform X2 [Chenopodium quinoa]|uniref:ATP-dependent Clp protease ATP-binding subunit CLPT1, chloroplastic-like isoform X2 n=1 Tax=Chenopodium quinoa TaxID=63459 RepID=UPI000B78937B|nr:ATP-dependent Clp protease ATP-binding subunit CLPT1, chloroplastic-like isoform X2 [Chenopodium quinoa]XP_021725269.1 ATP-dependent Clp protease ATP-binding subunit CLPT1, chloroplastic-like isoform X2 [Chenopodium quinoa]
MAAHTLTSSSLSSIASSSELRKINGCNFFLQSANSSSLGTSFIGNQLAIRKPNPNRFVLKRQSTNMTVSFSLPTSRPEGVPAEKSPKWSARAIKSYAMAELEARKLKYPNTGTEALLMGILVEGTSHAAKFLRANGITLFKVRDETVKLLGKSDMYYFSPEHPPLTEPAQKALDWAVDQKLKSGEDGEVTVTYLLLGLWEQKESAAHQIMADLGFNDEKVKELSKFMDKDIVLAHHN